VLFLIVLILFLIGKS